MKIKQHWFNLVVFGVEDKRARYKESIDLGHY